MADNDIDISKTHLDKAEQVIKLDFYLRLQNTKKFALRVISGINMQKGRLYHHFVLLEIYLIGNPII